MSWRKREELESGMCYRKNEQKGAQLLCEKKEKEGEKDKKDRLVFFFKKREVQNTLREV